MLELRAPGRRSALAFAHEVFWSRPENIDVIRPIGCNLLRGNHSDFNQMLRIRELRFDTSTPRKVLATSPSAPDFIHRLAVTNIRHPNGCRDDLALVSTAQTQK